MSLTAQIHLTRVVIQSVDGLNAVSCGSAGSLGGGGQKTDTFSKDGAFRTYANGVTRFVQATTSTRVNVTVLRALTVAQVKEVTAMVGKTCLYRDTYGLRVFSAFNVTSVVNIPLSGGLADVAISLQTVTYNEAV